jgi:hypothetical protein
MYTATVQLTITTFTPLSQSPSFQATIGAPTNTSPKNSGGSTVFSAGTPGSGQSIIITRPSGYKGSVQLTFQLYSSDYILAGIAVNSKDSAASTGRQQFRTVTLNRDQSGSQMIVTDALLDDADYTYLILVQAVTGQYAGQIGAIDPEIDNEGGE